jgi:hypothetical protein
MIHKCELFQDLDYEDSLTDTGVDVLSCIGIVSITVFCRAI